jgi:methanogen homocitrate synthase
MLKEINGFKMKGQPWFDETKWVSPMNFADGVMTDTVSKEVYIHDVTLRDGEQTTELNWTEEERIEIALLLNDLGVKSIEIGMPIVSQDIVRASQQLGEMGLKSELVGFCRAITDDVDAALTAKLPKIIIEHAVNPYTNLYGYRADQQKVIDRVVKAIDYAVERGLRVTFMGWDVTRSPIEGVLPVYEAVFKRCPVESVVFTDSFGVGTPRAIGKAIRTFKEAFPIPVEFHVHNEFGMAMGAVMEAVYAGVDGIHSSINGLGERTGNVATEEVIAALKLLLEVETGTDLSLVEKITTRIAEITGIVIPPNKPVSGRKLFWLESGVVVQAKSRIEEAGIPAAMTPYLASVTGRGDTEIVLGGSSGKENIQYYLDKLDMPYDETFDFETVLAEVKRLSRNVRRKLTDEEFRDIALAYGKKA